MVSIDLHRHISGSIRRETIRELWARAGKDPLDLLMIFGKFGKPLGSLPEFLGLAKTVYSLADRPGDWFRIATEVFEDASKELDMCEIRFSPHTHTPVGSKTEDLIDEIIQAKTRFTRISLIGGLNRSFGARACWEELQTLLQVANKLVGIDITGDESACGSSEFEEHVVLARAHNLGVTVHAGEISGNSDAVIAAITAGANRIGHGNALICDPLAIQLAKSRGITIECNISSNRMTGSAHSHGHPIKAMLNLGLLATINTDDPTLCNTCIKKEMLAAIMLGLTNENLRQASCNAIKGAF